MNRLAKILLIATIALIPVHVTGQDQQRLLRSQSVPQVMQQAPQTESGVYVSRAMFTTRISNSEPVSDLSDIETEFSQVFFFTELMRCDDCELTHKWYYNGKFQFEIESYSKWPHYKYWSSVQLKPSFVGTWTVKMYVEGELFVERSFNYYQPTEVQRRTQDIQQRLEKSTLSECEENLRYFSDQARNNPDEPYFQFMLEKWGDRCLK